MKTSAIVIAALLGFIDARFLKQKFATGMSGDEDLGQDIIMKGDKYHYNQRLGQFATGMNGDEDLGQDIIMKGDKYHYNQKLAQFATGMAGDEDLGQDIIMKGDKYHYNQKLSQFATGMSGDEDLGQDIIMKGDKYHYNQRLGQFATGMNGDEDLGQDIIMKGDKYHYNQRLGQFATGMNGDEDLGQDIIMKGDKYHFNQRLGQFATGMNGDEDLGQDIIMKGDKYHYNQKLAQGNNVGKDIAEPKVDEGVYNFVKPNVETLNWVRSDKPFAENGSHKNGWGTVAGSQPGSNKSALYQGSSKKSDIAEPKIAEGVYAFADPLVEVLPWNRQAEAYPVNGGAKGGWGSVAPPALNQVRRQDIANKEVRPDVYVTVRNMVNPAALWRSDKPPTFGNFEPYKGAVEVPEFANPGWKEPKKEEE